MSGRIITGLGLTLLLASCAPFSESGITSFGFSITGTSGAPRPPRVVIADRLDDYDDVGSRVYVVRDPGADCDVFRYGSSFYMYYSGYWYQSRQENGGFVAIDVRSVPRQVIEVPEEHWRHHPHGQPPGQRRKGWGEPS